MTGGRKGTGGRQADPVVRAVAVVTPYDSDCEANLGVRTGTPEAVAVTARPVT